MAEDYGPGGQPALHRTMGEIRAAWETLAAPPRDRGRVALIVARRADGVRETFDRAVLTPEEGVPGDRWGRLN